jgi:hypothetical protein
MSVPSLCFALETLAEEPTNLPLDKKEMSFVEQEHVFWESTEDENRA